MSEKRDLSRLIARAQNEDVEAFGAIYDRFFDSVYAYVLRQVGSATDAEDITSAVFLEVYEKIGDFQWRGAGFSAWLFRIARNDVRDHFRRTGRHRHREIDAEIEEIPAQATVDQLVERSWSEQRLREAVDQLSEEQRRVILLKLALNFSNRQIGEVLLKSEGAVKALQHRALLALRESLVEIHSQTG